LAASGSTLRRGGLAGSLERWALSALSYIAQWIGKHTQWTNEACGHCGYPGTRRKRSGRRRNAAKFAELSDKIMPKIEGFRMLSIEFEATEQPA
jgi:hypothetical protein